MYLATNQGLGEAMGPPRDPTLSPVQSPDVQQQIADIWSYLWDGPGSAAPVDPGMSVPVPSQTFTQWLNANSGKVALGAGGLLLVMAFSRGR